LEIKAKYLQAYEAIKSVINKILAQIEKFTCDVRRYISEALEWIREIPEHILNQFVEMNMIEIVKEKAKYLLLNVTAFVTAMKLTIDEVFENQFNKPVMQAFEAFNIFGFAFRDILSKATSAIDDTPGANLMPMISVMEDLDDTASEVNVPEISATQKILNYIKGANPMPVTVPVSPAQEKDDNVPDGPNQAPMVISFGNDPPYNNRQSSIARTPRRMSLVEWEAQNQMNSGIQSVKVNQI
jgi:hypothetical protein